MLCLPFNTGNKQTKTQMLIKTMAIHRIRRLKTFTNGEIYFRSGYSDCATIMDLWWCWVQLMTLLNVSMEFRYETRFFIEIKNQWLTKLFKLYSKDNRFTDPLAMSISRNCIIMSTAVLLLPNTIPSLTVSLMAPFLPFYIKCVTNQNICLHFQLTSETCQNGVFVYFF